MSSPPAETGPAWAVRLLDRLHDRQAFRCGEPELDEFLQQFAKQNAERDLGQTYVASPLGDIRTIAGYYTVSASSVDSVALPPAVTKRLPRYPVPVILVARLAVGEAFQGQRLGETLLLDAFEKARLVADIVGAHAIQVDALHEKAARFYEKYGFVRMVDRPRTLFLGLGVVRQALSLGLARPG